MILLLQSRSTLNYASGFFRLTTPLVKLVMATCSSQFQENASVDLQAESYNQANPSTTMAHVRVMQPQWDVIKETFDYDKRPKCLKFYTLKTVENHVTKDMVIANFDCYDYVNKAGRSENYYVLNVNDQKVAVRGITIARFMHFHHHMPSIAEQNKCSFEDSYSKMTGELSKAHMVLGRPSHLC
jgi:hypothetical protein